MDGGSARGGGVRGATREMGVSRGKGGSVWIPLDPMGVGFLLGRSLRRQHDETGPATCALGNG